VRKLLAPALCASAVAAPAVAMAATTTTDNSSVPHAPPTVPGGYTLGQRTNPRIAVARWQLHDRHVRTRDRRRAKKRAAASPAVSPALQAIAACESGGNPSAIGGGGTFRGKYQFDQATWQSIGGTGDPASAPVSEQDRLAAKLYAERGSSPWPVCGR
jgi:Transglycosylase-like domain